MNITETKILHSSRVIIIVGMLGVVMGIFFLFIRPLFVLLPEDSQFMGLSSDQLYQLNQNLFQWIGLVMRSWGAFILGVSVGIMSIAYYPYRKKEKWAWVTLLSIALVVFIPFCLVNIYLRSDFFIAILAAFMLMLGALLVAAKGFFRK
jgi:hypothetical protein